MISNNNHKKHLQKESDSPILKRISDKSGKADSFKVPEGYFETLPGRIMDRIRSEEQLKPRIIRLHLRRRILTAAAAAILLLAGVASLWLYFGQKHSEPVAATVPVTILDLADAGIIASVDDKLIVDLLLEAPDTVVTGTQQTTLEADLQQSLWSSDTLISDEDIKNYLVENNDLEALLYEPRK